MKQIIIINSHPIQYFAPLYKEMVEVHSLSLLVVYNSDESIKGAHDKGFGKAVKWNIPLLEGYKSIFLKNYSWKPSVSKGYFGLINFGIIKLLYQQPKSILIIHGWNYCTNVMAIFFGKLFGHTVCMRAETPLNQEQLKPRVKTFIKHSYLRILFSFIDKFLYIGTQNKAFYSSMSVRDEQLVFSPYSVDNKRFQLASNSIKKSDIRLQLGLPIDTKIILFSGKYIAKKRPLDLLQAITNIKDDNILLIMVGEGELRTEMEDFIFANHINHKVILTGFVNQFEITSYYKAADVFVMCSGLGETWGLSVNEAMNFGLPVIVSDTCGCAIDLVTPETGIVFKTGDIEALTQSLIKLLTISESERSLMQDAIAKKINSFSFNQITDNLKKLI